MKSLTPYLSFGDHTEAALMFYTEALGGRVTAMMRLGEVMKDTPVERRRQVLHAEFEAGGARLMATGCSPGEPAPSSTPAVALALECDDVEEQDRVWSRLVEGGAVKHPLHETFYGGRLGVLTDRFGTEWVLNCMLAPK